MSASRPATEVDESHSFARMSTEIKVVGVIGTGVIGASWTALFLAKGLQVIVSDPAPGAEEKLAAYLKKEWPILERIGLSPKASLSNYKFVSNIDDHLPSVDFVQEVEASYSTQHVCHLKG